MPFEHTSDKGPADVASANDGYVMFVEHGRIVDRLLKSQNPIPS
jgi:hypothetical protein